MREILVRLQDDLELENLCVVVFSMREKTEVLPTTPALLQFPQSVSEAHQPRGGNFFLLSTNPHRNAC